MKLINLVLNENDLNIMLYYIRQKIDCYIFNFSFICAGCMVVTHDDDPELVVTPTLLLVIYFTRRHYDIS